MTKTIVIFVKKGFQVKHNSFRNQNLSKKRIEIKNFNKLALITNSASETNPVAPKADFFKIIVSVSKKQKVLHFTNTT